MRHSFFILIIIFCIGAINSSFNTENTLNTFFEGQKHSKIIFEKASHDFGKIPQYKPVFHGFTYTNKSPYPIVIENVKTSCGCTTPKKPERPTMPGKIDTITVGYNAATIGKFRKTIMVKIAGEPVLEELVISGEVVKKEK